MFGVSKSKFNLRVRIDTGMALFAQQKSIDTTVFRN